MSSEFRLGPWVVQPSLNAVSREGKATRLEPKVMGVLVYLAEHPHETISKEDLIRAVWGDAFVTDDVLTRSISELRKALGDDAKEPRIIQTIPRKGYRLVQRVERESPDQTRKRQKPWVVLAASIGAIALLAVAIWHFQSATTATEIDSIAVLPFSNGGGDADTEYLSDGITESLISNLAHVPQLKVRSRNAVFRYKGKDVDVKKVGTDLGVSALVSGRVVDRGDSIEVSAELTDVRDNTEIWGQHYHGKTADLVTLQQQIAGDIAVKLRSKLSTSEKQQVMKQGTLNPEAYAFYMKGLYYWNQQTFPGYIRASEYFNQAISKDPGYALPYSGLADVHNALAMNGGTPSEDYAKSNAAARKALELDATLAHPHAVLGSNEMEYDWDFAGGEAEYKKACKLDPNDATVHWWYAMDIGRIGGREQEAIAEINRAHQLDPLSPGISSDVGNIHIFARHYDQAIASCTKTANDNPTFAPAHLCLASAYWGKQMHLEAMQEERTASQISGDQGDADAASAMEQGFRSAGWKGALRKGIQIGLAQRKTGYSSAYMIAALHGELGDKDQAFRWLNIAYQERDSLLVGLNSDFLVDPLRSDPRFAELVDKVGLPH